jgi:hypothetical protein
VAIWLVESSDSRIWRHNRPERVQFVDPAMLFKVRCYKVYQIVKHAEIDVLKNIQYNTSRGRESFHVSEDTF